MLILWVSFPSMRTRWLLPSSTATRIALLLISTDTWKHREKIIRKVPARRLAVLVGVRGQVHSPGMREGEELSDPQVEGGWESRCRRRANSDSSEEKGNPSGE